MECYGVIMAGGGGTRFWPLSRQSKPKQLLNLSGQGLMINETIDRIVDVIDKKNIFIVTNKKQVSKMKTLVEDGILESNILSEPVSRNTSACIGYAAMEIIKKYGDGVMCIFPSDHYIKDDKKFTEILQASIEEAKKSDKLITIGIRPSFPSTGYGYIQYDHTSTGIVKDAIEFIEKPDYKKAKEYYENGNYAWNSGMFIWKASAILENIKRFLPRVYSVLEKIGESMNTPYEKQTIEELYNRIPSISIDHGVMERSDDVVVIPAEFGWNDVGSWDTLGALYEMDSDGNVIKGSQINIDTKNCISYSEDRFIATIGVENLIVVETKDAVLVCKKDQAQEVKKVVDMIKEKKEYEYLL
ncbi:MAG: mannose-1-phosphate guanylyltransferase [bacterium]|nr:mannose-1-phosphate guanylyltransferase [bacterium]